MLSGAGKHGRSRNTSNFRGFSRGASRSHEAVFPDLKALLLAMPDAGEDADFSRAREYPRDIDLS